MTERRTTFLSNRDWYTQNSTPNLEESMKFLPEYKQDPMSTKYETSILRESGQIIDKHRNTESVTRDTGELLSIAEDFLRDPLMLHLSSSPDYAYTFGGNRSPITPVDPEELRRSQLETPFQNEDHSHYRHAAATANTPSPSLSLEYTE